MTTGKSDSGVFTAWLAFRDAVGENVGAGPGRKKGMVLTPSLGSPIRVFPFLSAPPLCQRTEFYVSQRYIKSSKAHFQKKVLQGTKSLKVQHQLPKQQGPSATPDAPGLSTSPLPVLD